jgi:arylsulfatase
MSIPVLLHAATIKQQYKRRWLGGRPGLVKNDFFDLYADPKIWGQIYD